jgi:hypothetical protein
MGSRVEPAGLASDQRPAPDIDVKYDALLADRRTLEGPEVFAVKPGQTVLLRLIAASSATNFFIDTGELDATHHRYRRGERQTSQG